MRVVVEIDDALLNDARRLTGLIRAEDVVREALVRLVQTESAARLARLGGSEPGLRTPERRSRGESRECSACSRRGKR